MEYATYGGNTSAYDDSISASARIINSLDFSLNYMDRNRIKVELKYLERRSSVSFYDCERSDKLKTGKDIRWTFEGKRQQFEFRSEIENLAKQWHLKTEHKNDRRRFDNPT